MDETYPAVLASFVKIKQLQRLGKCPGKPELSEVHQPLGCTCWKDTWQDLFMPCATASSSGKSAEVPLSCSDSIKYSTNTIFKSDFDYRENGNYFLLSLSTPSCEGCPLLAQQQECQNGTGFLALRHSALQLLEKPKYTVLQKKAETQPEVTTNLVALFCLPAVLQGGSMHILIFAPISLLWGRECTVSWSTLIQPYPPWETAVCTPWMGQPT